MKWKKTIIGNETLNHKDFYISYNPSAGHEAISDLVNSLERLIGRNRLVKDGEETALYDNKVWRILTGDFRKEYEKAFPRGLEACIAVYDKYKATHRNNWSTD